MFAAYVKRLQRILSGFQVEWRKSVDVHRDSGTALSLLFTFSFTCRCRMRKYYCDNWSVWRPFCHLLKGILLILLLLNETFNETAEKKVFLHYCTLCHFFLQVFFSVVEVEINGPFLEYCRKLNFFCNRASTDLRHPVLRGFVCSSFLCFSPHSSLWINIHTK